MCGVAGSLGASFVFSYSLGCAVSAVARGIVSCSMRGEGPGKKPGPSALGVQSLTHWTTREVPLGTSVFSLLRTSMLFSPVAVPIYIPTHSVEAFPSPHPLQTLLL